MIVDDTMLTALGIAIGIAAMVSVVGISASSRADLIADIDALGTDMLRVAPGRTLFGESSTLPASAGDTARRIGPVTAVYANSRGWSVDVPIVPLMAGVALALVVGFARGSVARRPCARLDPAESIRPA